MGDLPNLTDQEWQVLLKRLTLYANAKARKLAWRGLMGGDEQSMPHGHGPDSLASEAIKSVLNDERKCEAVDGDGLLRFLMDVVDSMISHLVSSAENRKTRPMPDTGRDDAPDSWHPASAPEDSPVARAAEAEAARVFQEKAQKALNGEPKLLELFECLKADFTGRKEIAEVLGVTEDEVTNLKKRLARKLDPLRIQTRKVPHGRTRANR